MEKTRVEPSPKRETHDLPWDPAQKAVEFIAGMPRIGWPMLRELIETTRKCFMRKHEEPKESRVGPAERSPTENTAECLDPTQSVGSRTLLDWGKEYLPEHFSKPPSDMHRWMAEHLDAMRQKRGTLLNVLGPRGGAKSTVGTLAYPLRAALEGDEPYVWIVSDTKEQAHAHLRCMRGTNNNPPRCVALAGEVGKQVACTIYGQRPSPCRR